MTRSISLMVDEAVPSLNKTLRMHGVRQWRLKRDWAWLLRAALNGRSAHNFGRAHVVITRQGAKLLDYDNLVGACKGVVIDNLRQMGFFEDDDPEHLLAEYRQQIGAPPATWIVIGPLA